MHYARDIFKKLTQEINRKEVTILLGPRQVGKTYLLKYLEDRLPKTKSSVFFNLEIPEDARRFIGSRENIFHLLTQSGDVVFLDEFHYLKNASQLFKAIFDSETGVKIFASGSSSLQIHKHLKESLAGRRRIIRIFPLSYKELQKNLRQQTEDYYLRFGGLPGVTQETSYEDRTELLNDLLQTYLLKDIKSLIKEENMQAFNMLLYLLAQNQGSLVSANNLANQIGLTPRSIQRYLDILIGTYVLESLPSYSRNLGNELKKSKKYYLYDIGIRNALLKNFASAEEREDKGCLIETAVFLNLRLNLAPDEELRFWRTRDGEEVDFILLKNTHPTPIEIKSTAKDTSLPSGLASFLRRYPKTPRAYILNMNPKETRTHYNQTEIITKHWTKCDDILDRTEK